ncbi:conjugal transfer protein, partial [Salmonella enterica subsp. enterica serovar Lubbock]|nr:conjugal transfer protein [Salmonella enterica subsp. enterica serovar Lubbock]
QSLAIGLVAIFCITLVPTIKQSVPLEKWNTLQTGVWYFYVAITDYWYLMLAVVATLAVTVYRSLSVWTGNLRFWFDRFPPWSVYRRLQGASFILNVNAMLSAGIPIETAIRGLVESSTSPWLLERLEAILRNIE